MFQLSLGLAVIGFAIGFSLGNRLTNVDRNAPIIAGIAGGVVFFLAAHVLTVAAVVAVSALVIRLALRAWPTVHETMTEFGRTAGIEVGRRRPRKSFAERLGAIHREYESRVESIRGLRLPDEGEEECLEMAESRLTHEVKAIADTPYEEETQL